MKMIYTNQTSKLTKKQRYKRDNLKREQKEIRKQVLSASKRDFKYKTSYNHSRAEEIRDIKSWNGDITCSTSKKESIQYTGTVVIGIGQMHKSNAVPVTNTDDAISIARMRR